MSSPLDRARAWKHEIAKRIERVVRKPPLVDFVIIGAEKAGTTLLQEVLRAVPGVAMPDSEVRYFRDPFYRDVNVLNDPIRRFDPDHLIGIKHPSYLGVDHVPERLRSYNPDLRLVVSLRDPVDRAVSSFYHYLARAQISLCTPDPAFARILSGDPAPDEPKYKDIYSFGCYHTHLQRYFDIFPPEQILILEYERLPSDRDSWQRLFKFLGISAAVPDSIREFNVGTYDWNKCVVRHYFHKLTCVHDEAMNAIDFRPDQPVDPQLAVKLFESVMARLPDQTESTDVSTATIERLVDAYRPEVERLIASGWLTPHHWRHFPAS